MASCTDSSDSVVFVRSPAEWVDDSIGDWESVGVSAYNESSRHEESHDGDTATPQNESLAVEERTDQAVIHASSSDHSSSSNSSAVTGTASPPQHAQRVDYASVESRIIQRLIQEDVVLASDLYAQSREYLTAQTKVEIAVYAYRLLDHEVLGCLFPGLQAPFNVHTEEPPTRARKKPPIWRGSRFVDELPQDSGVTTAVDNAPSSAPDASLNEASRFVDLLPSRFDSGVTTAVHNATSNAPDTNSNQASNSNASLDIPIQHHTDGFYMIAKDLDPTWICPANVTEMVNNFTRDATQPALLTYLEECGIVKPSFEFRHTHPTQLKSFITAAASMSTVFSVAVLFQTFERDHAIGRLNGFYPMDGDGECLCKDPMDCTRDDHSTFRMLACLVIVPSPIETSSTHVVSSSNQLPIGVIQWERDNTQLQWEIQRNQEEERQSNEAKAKERIIQLLIEQDISWASETYLRSRLELTRQSKQEIGECAIRLVDREVLDCLFPWLFKMDELQELTDRKEQGKEVDEVRLHELQLLERRNNGERLSEDELEDLESMQQQREEGMEGIEEQQGGGQCFQELNELHFRLDQGLEVDENRLYELELSYRWSMGETLTEVELEDLRYFAAERGNASSASQSRT